LGIFNLEGRAEQDVLMIANSHNKHSKSNGSLAKVTALAVRGAPLEDAKNFKLMKELCSADAKWIHPNPMVHDAIFLYCVAIGHLLNNPQKSTRARDAFNMVYELSKSDLANTYEVKKVDDPNST